MRIERTNLQTEFRQACALFISAALIDDFHPPKRFGETFRAQILAHIVRNLKAIFFGRTEAIATTLRYVICMC